MNGGYALQSRGRLAWVCAVSAGAAALGTPAFSQTTGTVFGPSVSDGERAAEYRFAFVFGEDGGDDEYAHRVHYQQAVNDRLRWRAIAQFGDGGPGDLEFQYVQGELQWQTLERTPSGYANALRFDFRLNEGDDRSHQFGANWTNEWVWGDGWRVRALALIDVDLGERARDGVFLEARSSLSRKLASGLRVGVETFSDLGNTELGIGSFEDQGHQAGPVVSASLGEDWGWTAGALLGVSDGAPDSEFVLRIARDF